MYPIRNTAGWSSPVARQAHNLKVAGSNPAPATNLESPCSVIGPGLLCVWVKLGHPLNDSPASSPFQGSTWSWPEQHVDDLQRQCESEGQHADVVLRDSGF